MKPKHINCKRVVKSIVSYSKAMACDSSLFYEPINKNILISAAFLFSFFIENAPVSEEEIIQLLKLLTAKFVKISKLDSNIVIEMLESIITATTDSLADDTSLGNYASVFIHCNGIPDDAFVRISLCGILSSFMESAIK